MIYLAALAFPFVLLLLLLGMERVERPLRRDAVSQQLDLFLATAKPDEVELFVSEGFQPALDRYWRRRAFARRSLGMLPGSGRPRTGSRAG